MKKQAKSHSKVKNFMHLMSSGRAGEAFGELKRRLWSRTEAFGLRRDMMVPFEDPEAKIPVHIREFEPSDENSLVDSEFENENPRLASYQRSVLHSDLKTIYVAVNEQGEAGYMQCLIDSGQNDLIRKFFKGIFPELKNDEGLLEAAFMNPRFRGLGIMPAAMSRIASKADEKGIRWTITFVETGNIPSLKGCRRAGFAPYIIREERWKLFRRTISFRPVPAEVMNSYNESMAAKPSKMAVA